MRKPGNVLNGYSVFLRVYSRFSIRIEFAQAKKGGFFLHAVAGIKDLMPAVDLARGGLRIDLVGNDAGIRIAMFFQPCVGVGAGSGGFQPVFPQICGDDLHHLPGDALAS